MSHRNAVVFYSKSVLAFAIASVISGWALGQDSGKTFNAGQSQPVKGVTILETFDAGQSQPVKGVTTLEDDDVITQNKILAQDASNKYLSPDEAGSAGLEKNKANRFERDGQPPRAAQKDYSAPKSEFVASGSFDPPSTPVKTSFAGLKEGKDSKVHPDGWPPEVTKVVKQGERATVGSGQEVVVQKKEGVLEFIDLQGGELTIEQGGTITSNISDGQRPEIYMIKSTAGTANKVFNRGVLRSAKYAKGVYAAEVIVRLMEKDDKASNLGTIDIQGVKRLNLPAAFASLHKTGSVTNEAEGTINILSNEGVGLEVLSGTATNKGTINLNGGTQNPSYGMQCTDYRLGPNVQDGAKILNSEKGIIKVSGESNCGMNVKSTVRPSGFDFTATNNGTINVTGRGGVGMSTDTDKGTLNNSGTINTSDGTTGIQVLNKGSLVHIGTVKGTGTGLVFQGDYSNSNQLSIRHGDEIKGSTAIKMLPNGKYPLYIYGGTITGDIVGNGGRNDVLDISPESEDKPVSITGDISGFPTIEVSGTGWTANGQVIDASSINTDQKGNIERISTGSLSNSSESLHLSFSQSNLADRSLAIHSSSGTTIKTVDLSSKDFRPALQLFLEGGEVGTLRGRSDLADELILKTGTVKTGVNNIHTIKVKSDTTSSWSVAGKVLNPNTIHIDNTAQVSNISTDSSPSSGSGNLSLAFDGKYTDDSFVTVDNHGTLDSLNFSDVSDRPNLKFLQGGEVTGGIKGRSDKQDVLELKSSAVVKGAVDDIHTIAVTGNNWTVEKPVTNPSYIYINSGEVGNIGVSNSYVIQTPENLALAFNDSNKVDTLTVENDGTLNNLDFSGDTNRPNLNFLLGGQVTGDIKGRSDKDDVLVLDNGTVSGVVSNIHTIKVTSTELWNLPNQIAGTEEVVLEKSIDKVVVSSKEKDGERMPARSLSILSDKPLTITSSVNQPTDLLLRDAAKIAKLENARGITIDSSNLWSVAGQVNNPESIAINEGALVKDIIADGSSDDNKTLNLSFSGTGFKEKSTFRVENKGTLNNLDFSGSQQRPPLEFIQSSDINAGRVIGLPGMGDTLVMKKGSVKEQSGFDNLDIKGASWDSMTMVNPSRLTIDKDGIVTNISNRNPVITEKGQGQLLLSFNQPTPPGQFFTLDNHGQVGTLDFSSNAQRPPLRFIQASQQPDSVTDHIKGQRHMDDTLVMVSGKVNKLDGVNNLIVQHDSGTNPWSFSLAYPLTDLFTITAGSKGHIETLSTQRPEGSNQRTSDNARSLYLSFNESEDLLGRNLTVNSLPESTIKEIDLTSGGYRPPLRLFMKGGAVTTIKGNDDRDDELILNAGMVAGAVENVRTITVTGNEWGFQDWATGTRQVSLEKPIHQIHVSDNKEHEVTTSQKDTLRINTSNNPVSIVSNAYQQADIWLQGKAQVTYLQGARDILLDSADDWSVTGQVENPKSIEIRSGAKVDNISTNSEPKLKTLALAFNGNYANEDYFKVDNWGTLGGLDFSSDSDRPSLQFVQSAGDTGHLKGRPGMNDTLIMDSGTIEGSEGFDNLVVRGSEWGHLNMVNLEKLTIEQGGVIAKVTEGTPVVTGKDQLSLSFNRPALLGQFFTVDNHGTVGGLDFSAVDSRPPLRFIQADGSTEFIKGRPRINDTLVMVKGDVGELDGVDNLIVKGDEWKSLTMKNPTSLTAVKGGVIHNITDDTVETLANDELLLNFTAPIVQPPGRQTFGINNEGGTIDNIDLSRPNPKRPKLSLNQTDGVTGTIKGQTGHGDSLFLGGGRVTERISGIDNIWLVGKNWETNAAIENPFTVEVTENAAASLITTKGVNANVGPLTLPLKFAQKAVPYKKVTLNTSGEVGQIKLDDPAAAKRPPINIIQKGGIIGSIQSLPGKGDTLDVQAGIVKGNMTGLDSMTFSGEDTQFGGQRIETMGTVNVTGKLTLTSNQTVSVTTIKKLQSTPSSVTYITNLHVAKGGTLTATRHNTVLAVEGVYRQDGRLELTLDKQSDPKAPYVKANFVNIGPDAVVLLDNKTDIVAGTEYLLMQSTDSDINARPTLETTTSLSRYTRIYPKLTARQLFVASIGKGTYVGDLARSGGANKSAIKAIETAVNRKRSSALSLLDSGDGDSDPLNTWVLNELKKDHDNPVKIAKIADQMTPDLSGATVGSAIASIRQAVSAVGARQSGLRTGIATGDMVSSGNLWLQYAYSDATQDKKNGYFGYEAKTNGFTLGVDSDLNEMMTLGVAYTYSKSDVKGTDGSKKTIDAEAHTLSAYFSAEQGPMFVDGRLGYTWGENDAKRYVLGNEMKAKYDLNSWDVDFLAGYKMALSGEWSWIPQLAFNYASIKTDDYKEDGVSVQSDIVRFDSVKNDTYEIMELGAGLKLLGDIDSSGMSVKPEVSLMAYHDFKDDPVTMTAHFAQGGSSFVVHGAKREQSRYQFGAAVNMETSNNLTFNLSYSYDWMDSYKAHGFIARASYAF